MSRVFLRTELEGVATFWRVFRSDGVALGFTSHDRDLRFGGILHRAAPGMVPRAIRTSASLDDDSAEVDGALSHDSISEDDLLQGRYDGARIQIGAVDWENLDNAVLYSGSLGTVTSESGGFSAELRSAKALLDTDPVPRTSPLCRARFCGPGCTLSVARHSRVATATAIDPELHRITFDGTDHGLYRFGELRWLDGPQVGLVARIVAADETGLTIDLPLLPDAVLPMRARLREGCDHTLATCDTRFGNAINFQGEPFLPGNDLLARYPTPQ